MKWRRNKNIDETYVLEEAEKVTDDEVKEAFKKRKAIEDKLKSSKGLSKYIEVVKQMFNMLNDYRKGLYKDLPWLTFSTIVFMVLYVLNPMDLVPDFIPIIGYLDDVTVLALGLNLVERDLLKYLKWKAENTEGITEE